MKKVRIGLAVGALLLVGSVAHADASAPPRTAPQKTATAPSQARPRPAARPFQITLIPGGSAEGRATVWTRQAVSRAGTQLSVWRADVADPAKRKQLLGNAAVGIGVGAIGQGTDIVLRHFGAPPAGAAFVSSALSSVAAQIAKRSMHALHPEWVSAPAKLSKGDVLGEALVAGSIGLGANIGLGKLGTALSRDLHANDAAAVAQLGARAGIAVGKRVLFRRWALRKADRNDSASE